MELDNAVERTNVCENNAERVPRKMVILLKNMFPCVVVRCRSMLPGPHCTMAASSKRPLSLLVSLTNVVTSDCWCLSEVHSTSGVFLQTLAVHDSCIIMLTDNLLGHCLYVCA